MDYLKVDTTILKEMVEDSGLSFSQNNVSWIFTCPRCDKAKKLYIRKKDGRFICWKCAETDNFKGRPEFALAELLGVSIREISEQLYGQVPLHTDMFLDEDVLGLDDFGIEEEDDFITQWPLDYYPIDSREAKKGRDYLIGRGIPPDMARFYDIRYNPESRRVYFPVSSHGKLFGWQGRIIIPNRYEVDGVMKEIPKILSSKEIQRDRRLMFLDRIQGVEHAVLCEGPVDALKAHYCKGNVATMGKAISPGQIRLLRSTGVKRIYLALDPDAADETQRLVDELGSEIELYEMTPKDDKMDLGAMSFEDVYDQFLRASPIITGKVFVFIDGT